VNLRNCPQDVLNKGTFWSHLHSSQTLELTRDWSSETLSAIPIQLRAEEWHFLE
jgi:hypothetical protein